MSIFSLPEQQSLADALGRIALPDCNGLSAKDAVTAVDTRNGKLALTLTLGVPANSWAEALKAEIAQQLQPLYANPQITVEWQVVATQPANSRTQVAGVKNIVAVASGKGGVGKSTTAVNIALALAAEGATVGVLDADIYGPSQAQMLGAAGKRPETTSPTTMAPIIAAGGIQMISMGNLVTENTPMIWRGPMVSGALQQLLNSTQWQNVDYLIVDMPPGTGDIQLTLAQSVPVSGAVVVTTPQSIALLDARKGIEMFRKVQIPVLGVVENMATHTCSNCGHEDAVFGTGGGERLGEEYDVQLLGRLPLQASIREQTDSGVPPVLAEPGSPVSVTYHRIAQRMAAALWQMAAQGQQAPEISMSDD